MQIFIHCWCHSEEYVRRRTSLIRECVLVCVCVLVHVSSCTCLWVCSTHQINYDVSIPIDFMRQFPVGTLYRHYESRQKVVNDAKPNGKEMVTLNNRRRQNKQSQKRESFDEHQCLFSWYWMSAWTYVFCIICSQAVCLRRTHYLFKFLLVWSAPDCLSVEVPRPSVQGTCPSLLETHNCAENGPITARNTPIHAGYTSIHAEHTSVHTGNFLFQCWPEVSVGKYTHYTW